MRTKQYFNLYFYRTIHCDILYNIFKALRIGCVRAFDTDNFSYDGFADLALVLHQLHNIADLQRIQYIIRGPHAAH